MLPKEKTRKKESNTPVFIIGLPRSGSTLWSHVMSKHPETAVFAEMHFLEPWHKDFRYLMRQVGDLSDEQNVRSLVGKLFSEPPAAGLGRGPHFWRSIRNLEDAGLADAILQRILASENRGIGFLFRTIIEERLDMNVRRETALARTDQLGQR